MKADKSQIEYKMNDHVKVVVKNVRKGEDRYDRQVQLIYTDSDEKPLEFTTKEKVRELIEGIDLEDPQTELLDE